MPRHLQQSRRQPAQSTVSLRQLQKHGARILDGIEKREEPLLVTRDGVPVAFLCSLAQARQAQFETPDDVLLPTPAAAADEAP